MSDQNLANHARWVPPYHYYAPALLLLALVGSITALVRALMRGSGRVESASLVLLVVACAIMFWYLREFPLKAQDRAIRAEEALRHYLLTGKPMDPRLTIGQVVALRFASDAELPALAQQAAEGGMKPIAIKQAIQSWRADTHRV
jgi:hypothetical protein